MCSHSHIADVDITVVLEHAGMDVPGVQLHQIIPGADVGDTAGVEEVLMCVISFFLFPYKLFVLHFFSICALVLELFRECHWVTYSSEPMMKLTSLRLEMLFIVNQETCWDFLPAYSLSLRQTFTCRIINSFHTKSNTFVLMFIVVHMYIQTIQMRHKLYFTAWN